MCNLLLHLGWQWDGAHGTERVERLLHMMVMVDMRMMRVVVVMVWLWPDLWLRVWSRLWYGSERVRLERACWERYLGWTEWIRRGGCGAWTWRRRRRGSLWQFS